MKEPLQLSLDDKEHIVLLGKALSVEDRIEILKLLNSEELNINEIAERLNIPPSTASLHVKVLEEANLIDTTLHPGIRGSKKVCSIKQEHFLLNMTTGSKKGVFIINMPIGNFVDYKVEPTCGIVSEKGPIDEEDEPRCFYNPERTKAQLLWFGKGYVEYRFPNNLLKEQSGSRLELSMEVCSEDHEYNLNYPTDITVWINGMDAGTFTCPSDFGGRRGKLNPSWWPDKNTQFGMLKTWILTNDGTFIDDLLVNTKTINDYHLSKNDYISVRIGMKDNASNIGGINLFGELFGDYNQNIIMKIIM